MKRTAGFLVIVSLLLISCGVNKDNLRLQTLFENDQLDRKQNHPQLSKNDIERLKEVQKMMDNNELKTSNDYFNAALIFQHGEKPEHYKMANQLANKAVEINDNNKSAKVLIAQSMDRYLLSINKPQIYGTQRITLGDKEYLEPLDTLQINDKERKKLGITTLKEKLEYFNKKHQKNKTNILAYIPSDSLIRVHFPTKRADLIGTFDELLAQIKYPEEALKNNISGKVLVEFTITPEGNTENIMVLEGIGFGCDEEAKRIVSIAKYKNYLKENIERRTRIPFVIK